MKGPLRLFCLLLLAGLCRSMAAYSQCLTLQALTQNLQEGRLTPTTLTASLPEGEWEMHQPASGPVYWSPKAPDPDLAAHPKAETRVELRRSNQQAQYDVLYKTLHKDCINDLRSELRRVKLKPEPVTCLQCEGERYTASAYTITIYNQQENFNQGKAPYPFVLVVHPLAPGETPTN